MSDIPYLTRRNQHKVGKAGRASERRLAKELGGKERPASGAKEGIKGDISFGAVLVEAKSTINDSMSLKLEWLLKITHEARTENKMPALAVSFVRPDGTPLTNGDWVLIPKYKFRELTE